jgi:hypothetical protein
METKVNREQLQLDIQEELDKVNAELATFDELHRRRNQLLRTMDMIADPLLWVRREYKDVDWRKLFGFSIERHYNDNDYRLTSNINKERRVVTNITAAKKAAVSDVQSIDLGPNIEVITSSLKKVGTREATIKKAVEVYKRMHYDAAIAEITYAWKKRSDRLRTVLIGGMPCVMIGKPKAPS